MFGRFACNLISLVQFNSIKFIRNNSSARYFSRNRIQGLSQTLLSREMMLKCQNLTALANMNDNTVGCMKLCRFKHGWLSLISPIIVVYCSGLPHIHMIAFTIFRQCARH
jgi:hypothetical protein